MRPNLSFVIPTHTDTLGVWPTIMSFKITNKHVLRSIELVIVDQAPETPDGKVLRQWMTWAGQGFHSAKYVAAPTPPGSAPAKERAFQEASGKVVLCTDSHVILWPGAVDSVLEYYDKNPDSKDMLCGPMIYDNMETTSTHLDNQWSTNQWGQWREARICKCGRAVEVMPQGNGFVYRDPAYLSLWKGSCPGCGNTVKPVHGQTIDMCFEMSGFHNIARDVADQAQPFPVWAQGTGLMCMSKHLWVGFTPGMKGFGGEEVLIHMRVRRAGGKVMCVPKLRWTHRFLRVQGPKYGMQKYHHIRNYVLGFKDVGMDLTPIHDHFFTEKTHGETLEKHLMKFHGLGHIDVNGKTQEELQVLHRKFISPQNEWQMIIAGQEDPPCKTCGDKSTEGGNQEASSSSSVMHKSVKTHPTIEAWYNEVKSTGKGLAEHCETLKTLASKCHSVSEISKNINSTVCLLSGVKGNVTTYKPDVDGIFPDRELLNKLVGDRLVVGSLPLSNTENDKNRPTIAPTDMLVILTAIRGDSLYQYLSRNHNQINRYIAIHNTALYGEFGDGHDKATHVPGLLVGLRRFTRENPCWSVVEDYQNGGGLTVLSKNDSDKEQLPSMITMAGSFLKARINHAIGGKKTSEEKFQKRLEICSLCPKRNNDRCGRCGCPIIDKASMDEQECPIGKWFANGA